MARWPLFDAHPALASVLAPLELCALPTPIAHLPAIGPRAWIKRDDVTHGVYGGNKMRKLEFVAAEWQRRGARRVVTFGATGTNAGVAASMVARDLGVACEILTFDQPPSATVTKNAALMRAHGAIVRRVPTGSLFLTALAFYAHPRRLDARTYFMFAGCSNPVAVFAYVNAAYELRAQIDAGVCPMPAEIVVAAGTAATLAGLTLGCALAGISARVTGVRVAPSHVAGVASCTPAVVTRMMNDAARAIGGNVRAPEPVLVDAWYGPGYGATTPAADEAVARARASDVALEQTYTGKAFAAFTQLAQTSERDVLFWNTFDSHA